MPKLPGVRHLSAINALEKRAFGSFDKVGMA
jgi:hypothetical protein